jgi:hypothetical protein
MENAFKIYIFGPMDSLLFFNTQTMHISYTFAGFEPGTSDPEANAMSTLHHAAKAIKEDD